MCGITGWIDEPGRVAAEAVRAATAQMTHRGPQGEGFHEDLPGGAVLGHRRLAVIDVEGGRQPLTSEDGRYHLVGNGEIYNFHVLRRALETRGHRFATRSDTEVILHLFEDDGISACASLEGMFAFALWDAHERTLWFARDRLGQKPFLYFHDGSRFLFASEFAALLAYPDLPRRVDPAALDAYLAFMYIPAPLTIWSDVRKLPPGTWGRFHDGRLETHAYWEPSPSRTAPRSREEAETEVFRILADSVKARRMSDVPIGVFLSGGTDSSIITGLLHLAGESPIRTFSIGFEEETHSELPHARAIARHFSTDHHEEVVLPDAVDLIPRLVRHYGEPFADSSAIPTWYLAAFASRHVRVALAGDGGDENFAGYERHLGVQVARWADLIPPSARGFVAKKIDAVLPLLPLPRTRRSHARRFLRALALGARERYVEWVSLFTQDLRRDLHAPGGSWFRPERTSQFLLDAFDRAPVPGALPGALYVDLVTYLPHDLLVKVDIASMAHGLEVRCPFLDHYLVEWALALPAKWKIDGCRKKKLLRSAFQGLLPQGVMNRPKQGFAVPLDAWFRGPLRGRLEETLLDPLSLRRGLFRREALHRLFREHFEGRARHGQRLYALLFLELWFREWNATPP